MKPAKKEKWTNYRSTLTVWDAIGGFLGENSKVRYLRAFWSEERGQDLVEYSLLLAFICLAGAAMFIGMSNATTGLWSAANNRLSSANQ